MWQAVACEARAWLERQGVAERDAVLLVPYAALLAPARAAFAERGGWMPRVETPLTLAEALSPPPEREAGACLGDSVADRLHGAALLRGMAALAAGERSDPKGFAAMAERLADTAAALRSALLCLPPAQRGARSQALREALTPTPGPGALESALLAAALEWAAGSAIESTDALFTLRPGAWIAVQVAGCDELSEGVLAASTAPALRIVTDAPGVDPFADVAAPALLRRFVCADAEAEAQAAAAAVIDAINAGRTPVALVALDRLLVRRVRALLERREVELVDETGWRLSTTVAGTRIVRLLRAAHPRASDDERLAWLKQWPRADAESLRSLEAQWRGSRRVPNEAAATRLADVAKQHLATLGQLARQPLADWLMALHDALASGGELAALRADAAGRQAIDALWLGGEGPPAAAAEAARRWHTSLAGFSAWVEAALDAAPFLPPLPESPTEAYVVIAPLARTVGRPFAHIVLAGADERHLGSTPLPPGLIAPAVAETLGLRSAKSLRLRQRQAIAQLLRAGGLSVLRRRVEDDAAVAASPDLEWLWLRLVATAQAVPPEEAWSPILAQRLSQPVSRPQPRAAEALPGTLSATRLDDLRGCPYRFFARTVLRLEESEELDEPLSKRDYGNWLHELLHAFHKARAEESSLLTPLHDHGRDLIRDLIQLQAAADTAAMKLGLDAGDLLPFRASFEAFAPAYLRWQHAREAAGWRWADGEAEREIALPGLTPPLLLGGRIDRIDSIDPGLGGAREVLDYKAGNREAQRDRVRDPQEDTQLAFYAALLQGDGEMPPPIGDLKAAYVALDDAKSPVAVEHREVERTARTMLHHLAGEWSRLRAGAPLLALGEAPLCDYCEVRGLCRRDQWAASDAPDEPGTR